LVADRHIHWRDATAYDLPAFSRIDGVARVAAARRSPSQSSRFVADPFWLAACCSWVVMLSSRHEEIVEMLRTYGDSVSMTSRRALSRWAGQPPFPSGLRSPFGYHQREAILQEVRLAASKRLLFLPHAVGRMNRPARMISPEEVRGVVDTGVLIEDYPDDPRGHSCLLGGPTDCGRQVHVVCSPKSEYLAVITAYVPDPVQWENNGMTRKGGAR
jgi:hypothetical protein